MKKHIILLIYNIYQMNMNKKFDLRPKKEYIINRFIERAIAIAFPTIFLQLYEKEKTI